MPKRVTKIVCVTLLVSTILIIGLLYRSNLNEADDLLKQYNKNTQQFDRTSASTVREEIPDKSTGINPPYIFGIPDNYVTPITQNLEELIMMPDEEVWKMCSNGRYTAKPKKYTSAVEAELLQIKSEMCTTIQIQVWQWSGSGYDKVAKTINLDVNKALAPLYQAVFKDIFNHPEQPVISIAGCYNVRNTTESTSVSAHSIGAAVDLNWDATIDGYGNGWRKIPPTKEQWQALDESKKKYEMFYIDCPIVSIFKSYGFVWGGDFSSKKDGMHFSFIGDNKRAKGQENYKNYRR